MFFVAQRLKLHSTGSPTMEFFRVTTKQAMMLAMWRAVNDSNETITIISLPEWPSASPCRGFGVRFQKQSNWSICATHNPLSHIHGWCHIEITPITASRSTLRTNSATSMFANASNMFSRVLKKCGMGEDDDHLQVASITACNAPKKAAHKSVVGVKAAWATDTNNCGSCETRFGLFKRRHHCRSCGICVCADCSPHKATVAGYSTPQIICSSCETERSVIAKRKQALVLLAGVRVGAASSPALRRHRTQ